MILNLKIEYKKFICCKNSISLKKQQYFMKNFWKKAHCVYFNSIFCGNKMVYLIQLITEKIGQILINLPH